MIVVIEGISASGKTTWCTRHGAGHVIPEHGRIIGAPDRQAEPEAAGRFWADQNERRWGAALAEEAVSALAICDGDPLKLHYIWSLWRIGAASKRHWIAERDATRESLRAQRLGFADAYFVTAIQPSEAQRQRDADPMRARRNFEQHVRLQKPLLDWYRAFATVLPQPVSFAWPIDLVAARTGSGLANARYDLSLFDAAMVRLPGGA